MQKVSVIMSVYNGEKYLQEAIDSILMQSYQNWELIIVDDGSTDDTKNIINKYLKAYPDKIRYLYQCNKGSATARNQGIKESEGDYIAILDADDIALPTRLEKQAFFLDKNPHVGLIGSSAYIINAKGKIIGKARKLGTNDTFKKELFIKNRFTHSSVMFRKKCIDKIGFYNEEIRYAQDYDLWIRIAKYFDVTNLSEFLCMYRIHLNSVSINNKVLQDRYADSVKEQAKSPLNTNEQKFTKPTNIFINLKIKSQGYFYWSQQLYEMGEYSGSLLLLLKAFIYAPYNYKIFKSFYVDFIIRVISKIMKSIKLIFSNKRFESL